MGSIARRLVALERIFGPPEADRRSPERERIIAELRRADEEGVPLREVAEREAAVGFPQRLRALEDLDEAVGRREA